MMKITGLSHLFKWENLHNWWLTKYFFAPLYAFSLHIQFASSLEGRSPKTFLCYKKERGLKQMFTISKSAQSVYAGLGHTHTHIYIYIYIYTYNGRIT